MLSCSSQVCGENPPRAFFLWWALWKRGLKKTLACQLAVLQSRTLGCYETFWLTGTECSGFSKPSQKPIKEFSALKQFAKPIKQFKSFDLSIGIFKILKHIKKKGLFFENLGEITIFFKEKKREAPVFFESFFKAERRFWPKSFYLREICLEKSARSAVFF